MKKTYCNICRKEIPRQNETWQYTLSANEENKRVSFDSQIEEICECCASILHCCVSMMKHDWKPDYHELYEQKDAAGTTE